MSLKRSFLIVCANMIALFLIQQLCLAAERQKVKTVKTAEEIRTMNEVDTMPRQGNGLPV